MNEVEYTSLTPPSDFITLTDLSNKLPRTLLFGYTCDRKTWHTYSDGKEIITVIYGCFTDIRQLTTTVNEDYIPNKRLYVECCDFEFCSLLQARKIHLPFTTPNFTRPIKTFYGQILE